MKLLFIISMFFIIYLSISEAQTNANIPGPENVLVVYKAPDPNNPADTVSQAIKDYYVAARNIPTINVVPLELPRKVISVGDWSDPHVVKLGFDDQNIVDSTWAKWDSTHCVDTAKFHAWQYFIEEIANPIRDHLENNNLTSTIRYIVMCQGVPYKIQAVGDWSSPGNVSVDGLLCMLNTDDYDDFVETIFNNLVDDCYPGCVPPPNHCYSSPVITNPYFDKLVKRIRSKFKAELITTKETIATIENNYRNNVLSLYGFASDQSPRVSAAHHWASFMGHVVPVHTGAEMLAKRFDMNVIFLRTKKVKRGYYEASFELLSDDVKSVPNYEITDQFMKLVEQQIYEAPEFYLWTHKRWKHIKEKAQ